MTIRGDYTHENIDASGTGTTELGPVQIHRFGGAVYAKLVSVQQVDAADAEWNVNLNGNAIFSVTQTVSASNQFEEFIPDQNRHASGQGFSMDFEVTTAGTSTLIAGVLLETAEHEQ